MNFAKKKTKKEKKEKKRRIFDEMGLKQGLMFINFFTIICNICC